MPSEVTEVPIVNTHIQVSRAGIKPLVSIVVSYGTQKRYVDGWSAYGIGFQTDPKAPWYQYGCKWFSSVVRSGTFHERQKAALLEAIAWTSKKYGHKEWTKNKFGAYVPVEVERAVPTRKKMGEVICAE